ncbi:MAG: FAD-dependent oxidoreductase [Cyanobacteria bacterium J06581_3]
MRLYSAAIIGTSPAGCTAAIALARKGLKVLLIDVSEFSGDRVEISSSSNSSPPNSSPPNKQRSARLGKSLRNQSLMTLAQAQGVEVWKACRVDTAIVEQQQLMGLTTERGTVRAYHILDASGQRQWLSQQLGVGTTVASPEPMDRCKPVAWQMRDPFAGPGWWLLGNAAANPSLAVSCGLLRTFAHRLKVVISGLQAASAIADCEHGKISEAIATQRYSQWLHTWFVRDSGAQHSKEHTTYGSLAFPMRLELDHKPFIQGQMQC